MSLRLSSVCSVFVLLGAGLLATAQPGDGSGAYATRNYRNLFAEAGHSHQDIQAKIDVAFHQLFHGDPQNEAIAFHAGSNANGPLMYITDWANHDVRTEGMSYAMMIAVQLNKKAEFDAIWNWARTYMYISDPKAPSYRYFAWSCKYDGTHNSEGAAPDGEEYFAMALLFASNRWGDGKGIYDYHAEADKLLTAMVHRPVISAPAQPGSHNVKGQHTVGPMVNLDPPMILFVPEITPEMFTDPSYHLPAFYELWARWGPKQDRAFWAKAAETSRAFFVKTTNPKTGLAPVYANFDGTPHKNHFVQSDQFGYDAWRTASNWSVDWSWWRKAPDEQQLSDRIQRFFASQGIDGYGPVYTLDGTETGASAAATHRDPPTGLVGTNAVAGLAATDKELAKRFTDSLWNTRVPSGQYRYYDGMLYMMSLMHVSGEFRIWKPKK